MKYLILILICIALSGCTTTDKSVKTMQPSNNKMWKPEQSLFYIKAHKIILEGETVTTTTADGKTVTECKDVEFWVKDTSARPPLTWLDIVKSGLGYGVIYGLGYQGLVVIKAMSDGLSKSPLVVKPEVVNNQTSLVGLNGDGVPFIDRG